VQLQEAACAGCFLVWLPDPTCWCWNLAARLFALAPHHSCTSVPPLCCSTIPDEEAVKPEGWLDDEAAEVDDPGKPWASLQHEGRCAMRC
jgi:hypothetical protein